MDDGEASAEEDTRQRGDVRRSSLSLFAKIPNLDLSALIRSSSLTSRRVSGDEDRPHTRRRSRKVTLDYVKQEMLDDVARKRTSRPTKADPGVSLLSPPKACSYVPQILNLISHSRSPSPPRSKAGEEAVHLDTVDVPVLRADAEPDPQSPHKPSELLQSRPLSAATTNTASTVTPANVTPRKRPPTRIPIATVQEEPAPLPKEARLPQEEFPHLWHPASQPQKILFWQSAPRRRQSQKPRRPQSTASFRQSPHRAAAASPTPKPKPKLAKPKPKPDIGQGSASTSRLDNLSKFFVGTGLRVSSNPEPPRPAPPSHKRDPVKIDAPQSPASPKPTGPHITPSNIVADPVTPKPHGAHPGRRYMSEVGNTARVHEPGTPTPAPRVQSSGMSSVGGSTARARVSGTSAVGTASTAHVRSSISNPRASIVGPRTSTTGSMLGVAPAPRVRAISSEMRGSRSAIGISTRTSTGTTTTTTTTTSSPSTRERRPSTDSAAPAYRAYRPTRLGGIEEDRWKDKVDDNSGAEAVIRATANGNSNSGKHVISSRSVVRTPTTTALAMTTATATAKSTIGTASGRKHGSFDFERPGWGSTARGAVSSLGVASRARRDVRGASGSVDGRGDRATGAGMAGVGAARVYASASATHRSVRVMPPPPPPPEQLQPDHTGASGSTSHSNATGGTSSWGRSTGKRLSAGLNKLTSGLGLSKSKSILGAGNERQRGKFPFEPPVPALPSSVRRELSADSGERERERQWEWEDRERRAKPPLSPRHYASHSTLSWTSSTPTAVSVGHRSGTKGRSLDLGLGLAWAPTKVREDAVMPESSFGRSLNASRREQQGKEIAEVFRNALDEDGYRSFKKYVHRFDAHEIPFDGPTGIVTRVERLLRKARHIDDTERERLLDSFVKLILQSA
ncbi:hypothetical protein FB451DRAFT_1161391 [Mycena latifolia]|nr:hypothetical protein FB451DRAFT_1161391 [Mycena latifolia]